MIFRREMEFKPKICTEGIETLCKVGDVHTHILYAVTYDVRGSIYV